MNTQMESKVFGPVSIEIDHRNGGPLVCIGNAATSGYVWLDEEQAAWVRDWLNECFADNGDGK